MLTDYNEKISRRLLKYKKTIKSSLFRPHQETLPTFIMGCGRSGTTMMINIFHRDHRVEALDENDPRIAQNYMLEFDKIPEAINSSIAPILVMKPILNSFDASNILETYSKSKVLWMLRDYNDMIASSIKKFGTKVPEYMKDLIMHGKGSNWLSRGIPLETKEIISSLETSHFTHYDWMALVWWSVNRTVIIDHLTEHDRFLLIKYETLVNNPEAILKPVYELLGLKFQKKTTRYIHKAAIGKGAAIELHRQVEGMCQDLAHTLTQLAGHEERG